MATLTLFLLVLLSDVFSRFLCQESQLWRPQSISEDDWQEGFVHTVLQFGTDEFGAMKCGSKCQAQYDNCVLFMFNKVTGECILGAEKEPREWSGVNTTLTAYVRANKIGTIMSA